MTVELALLLHFPGRALVARARSDKSNQVFAYDQVFYRRRREGLEKFYPLGMLHVFVPILSIIEDLQVFQSRHSCIPQDRFASLALCQCSSEFLSLCSCLPLSLHSPVCEYLPHLPALLPAHPPVFPLTTCSDLPSVPLSLCALLASLGCQCPLFLLPACSPVRPRLFTHVPACLPSRSLHDNHNDNDHMMTTATFLQW